MTERNEAAEQLRCGYFTQCMEEADHPGPHITAMRPAWVVPTLEPIAQIGPPVTAAGQHYALQPPGSLTEWEEAIGTIEAAERRATVERIRAALAVTIAALPNVGGILDAEAER